ncbi:hypothetical protein [Vibrio navarrensis]
MYGAGEGVNKDPILEYMWYSLAKHNGHQSAQERIESTSKKMDTDSISKAQEMVERCLVSNYSQCGY